MHEGWKHRENVKTYYETFVCQEVQPGQGVATGFLPLPNMMPGVGMPRRECCTHRSHVLLRDDDDVMLPRVACVMLSCVTSFMLPRVTRVMSCGYSSLRDDDMPRRECCTHHSHVVLRDDDDDMLPRVTCFMILWVVIIESDGPSPPIPPPPPPRRVFMWTRAPPPPLLRL